MLELLAALGVGGFIGWEVWKGQLPKEQTYALPTTKRAFIKALADGIGNEMGIAGKRLAIAWAAYETNWGRTTGWLKGNNPWNISAGSKWTGPTVEGKDTEVQKDGSVKDIVQKWRVYKDIPSAVEDMLSFIAQSQFGSAKSKLNLGDVTFTDELKKGSYYTLDAKKYQQGVKNAISEVTTYGA
jgi:flagellum-specific peptidoglycan hydrolase FlgJ